ncbi:hypothetical protein STAQ_07350 [Allostella sp. ATCC 35155]|nr:hypothetical protein STAQ_07350 [Stella sp. ATCC 35155]
MPIPDEGSEDFYEEAPCGYATHRAQDGVIVRMNRTLAQWLGHASEGSVGIRRFQDLLSPPGRVVHETRHLMLLRSSGFASALAMEMVHANGERMPVLITSQLRRDSFGTEFIRSTIFDGTAHMRYERQLIEARDRAETAAREAQSARAAADAANRAKSCFLRAMNHEFRTPIHAITGFAELLTTAGATIGEGAKQQYLGRMQESALHLLGLLEDATRYASLDAMEGAPAADPVRLRTIVENGLALARPILDRRQVLAVQLPDADEPAVLVDGAAAAEALSCVLRDVARRAPPRSNLRVGVRRQADGSAIELRGTALPQSRSELSALLSPLDAPAVMNRGLEGSGLGIAYAHRVLGLFRGALTMDHTAESGFGLIMTFASDRSAFNARLSIVPGPAGAG